MSEPQPEATTKKVWDIDYARKVLLNYPCYHERLGGVETLNITEIGDGNLNYIYVVAGVKETIVLKIAPPFVRVLPEWAMSTKRAFYEYSALVDEYKVCPQHVPEVFGYHPEEALIVMKYIQPHIILRKGMMAGIEYPLLAEHIATFFANTLFFTSDLFLKNKEKRESVAKYLNNDMLFITEQLFFQEPYMEAKNNHWTKTDEMDKIVHEIQSDNELKVIVAEFHRQFQNDSQALLHADMHSGSIMVTQDSTIVIDPEFAFYGPMGFDIGSYFANCYLSFFGQSGLAPDSDRSSYKKWIVSHVERTWELFYAKFVDLWNTKHEGDLFLYFKNADAETKKKMQSVYLKKVLSDTIAYTGIEMIRRTVGFAHVADLEEIKDVAIRSPLQVKVLTFAVYILKNHLNLSIADLSQKVNEL